MSGSDLPGRDARAYARDKQREERRLHAEACQYCGNEYTDKKEHMMYHHIGNECQWPGCSTKVPENETIWDHMKSSHPVAVHNQNGRWACLWPGKDLPEVQSQGSAERQARYTQYEAYHLAHPEIFVAKAATIRQLTADLQAAKRS
ncbi:hypothetical protein F5Y16DRAFT_406259 [Xylariaceae sp. FL0255]|nr:hypothetical protein F5Y16DRAFT_406259 [Xylariaceae sp. FL0255]